MEEISNKTLAILLIAAIVISLGGTLISLNRLARIRIPSITGFGTTDTAGVNLSITGVTEVNWTTDDIYWESGTVTTGTSTCTLTSYDGNTNTVSSPLVLENIGNTNVTLNITCGKTAATFIGHADAVYQWNASNKEPGSCPGLAISAGAFQTASTDPVVVCNSTGGGFLATDGSDTMNFDVRVVIPSAAPSGSKTSTFTATATEN